MILYQIFAKKLFQKEKSKNKMNLNEQTKKYWTDEDIKAVEEAKDFKDLYAIANRIFSRMEGEIGQVCGPIATGGAGSIEANLEIFNNEILKLQNQGKIIFDQMPFEWPMQDLKKRVADGANTILEDFYLPIFESGKVKTLYFIKGWETSYGANWEHNQAKRLGIDIVYLN